MLIPYAGMGHETVSMTYGQPSLQARYVVKYKHNEGKLVLKITDDRTVRTRPIFARSKLTMLSPLRLYLHRPSHNVISVPTAGPKKPLALKSRRVSSTLGTGTPSRTLSGT